LPRKFFFDGKEAHKLEVKSAASILSFGSSTGEEAITLATDYFGGPKYANVKIFGADIDEPTLEKARENIRKQSSRIPESKIVLFNGRNTNIDVHGRYDIIFANRVLCYHGPYPLEQIVNRFPFSDFESILATLDASLKVGGIIAIVNMSYNFEDSELARRYEPVSMCTGNLVPRVSIEKNRLIDHAKTEEMNCVWVKKKSAGATPSESGARKENIED